MPNLLDNPKFKAWFKDSKVVDAEGNPLRVYHGTTGDFSRFDRSYRGSNTRARSAKQGFFFVDDPEVAGQYAFAATPRPGRESKEAWDVWGELQRKEQDLYKQMRAYEEEHAINAYRYKHGEDSEYDVIKQEWHKSVRETEAAFDKAQKIKDRFGSGTLHGAYSSYQIKGGFAYGANTVPVYLSIQNPLVHDFHGRGYRDVTYNDLITQAKKAGNDGVILLNTEDAYASMEDHNVYVAFNATQIKSAIGNKGGYRSNRANVTESLSSVVLNAVRSIS